MILYHCGFFDYPGYGGSTNSTVRVQTANLDEARDIAERTWHLWQADRRKILGQPDRQKACSDWLMRQHDAHVQELQEQRWHFYVAVFAPEGIARSQGELAGWQGRFFREYRGPIETDGPSHATEIRVSKRYL